MPPINGLLETSLYVEDLQKSAQFYQSLFGFTPMVMSERLIAMEVKEGQVLLLFKKRGSLQPAQGSHDGNGRLHLAFAVDASEVEPWRVHLHERNIAIAEEITWERGGDSVYFRDPDGHLLEIGSPGIWANY